MAFRSKKLVLEEKLLDVDASIQGSLSFKDPVNLRINGKFEGTLNTKGNLKIGSTAQINANITGEDVVISGKVKGDIVASKKLSLLAGSNVKGNIRTPILHIQEGAVFEGNCAMLEDTLTAHDLAKYLEVELNSILEWATSGKIPAVKEGDNWKFQRAQIDDWVASGKI